MDKLYCWVGCGVRKMKNIFKSKKAIIIVILSIIIVNYFFGGEGKFVETGSMNIPRIGHSATLLQDGRVLIAGGYSRTKKGEDWPKSAEIYDPKTGKFTMTGDMNYSHSYHTTILLKTGEVLIVTTNPEIYNPKTGKFRIIEKMPIVLTRLHGGIPTSTLLNDGRILILGKPYPPKLVPTYNDEKPYNITSGIIYNPITEKFKLIGKSNIYHLDNCAALLSSGGVLILGGYKPEGEFGEVYNPKTNTFSPTKKIIPPLANGTATLLNNKKVLLIKEKAYLYDEKSSDIYNTKGRLKSNCKYNYCTATLLDNGKVLILGGHRNKQELYNPDKDKFCDTKKLKVSSFWHTTTLLKDGDVLITGGSRINGFGMLTRTSDKAYLYKY